MTGAITPPRTQKNATASSSRNPTKIAARPQTTQTAPNTARFLPRGVFRAAPSPLLIRTHILRSGGAVCARRRANRREAMVAETARARWRTGG
ncbi:hypothetical protein GCM10010439_27430 [Actinocorallia aurantiaca]|uniref:Uncharacterized protein n=1 Tax=Actinocorallia aurantiaca TaxID=46204 RepID=A0ABN3U7C8_9ACTN